LTGSRCPRPKGWGDECNLEHTLHLSTELPPPWTAGGFRGYKKRVVGDLRVKGTKAVGNEDWVAKRGRGAGAQNNDNTGCQKLNSFVEGKWY